MPIYILKTGQQFKILPNQIPIQKIQIQDGSLLSLTLYSKTLKTTLKI